MILGKQQLWLCFRYWAEGSGTAHRSFSGGHGAQCFPCYRPGQSPALLPVIAPGTKHAYGPQ